MRHISWNFNGTVFLEAITLLGCRREGIITNSFKRWDEPNTAHLGCRRWSFSPGCVPLCWTPSRHEQSLLLESSAVFPWPSWARTIHIAHWVNATRVSCSPLIMYCASHRLHDRSNSLHPSPKRKPEPSSWMLQLLVYKSTQQKGRPAADVDIACISGPAWEIQ